MHGLQLLVSITLLLVATACVAAPELGRELPEMPTAPGEPADPDGVGEIPPVAAAPCPSDADTRFADVLDRFRGALDEHAVPGGALAVVCGGRLAYVEAVGNKRQSTSDPVTLETRFQWASSSKI